MMRPNTRWSPMDIINTGRALSSVYALNNPFRKGIRRVGRLIRTGGRQFFKPQHRGVVSNNPKTRAIRQKSSTRRGRRGRGKRKKPSLRKKVRRLSKRLTKVACAADAGTGTNIVRHIDTFTQQTPAINGNSVQFTSMWDLKIMEGPISSLQVWDPATGAYITSNFADPLQTTNRKLCFHSIQAEMKFRNSCDNDVHIRVYLCTLQDDTDDDPTTAWTAGIADNEGSSWTIDSPDQYPSDYANFRSLWKTKVIFDSFLAPAQHGKVSHKVGRVIWNPAITQSQTQKYQSQYKHFGFLVVIGGRLAHSAGNSAEVGRGRAALDFEYTWKTKVEYEAGRNIKYLSITGGRDVMTVPVQSQKPIAQNRQFNVAFAPT